MTVFCFSAYFTVAQIRGRSPASESGVTCSALSYIVRSRLSVLDYLTRVRCVSVALKITDVTMVDRGVSDSDRDAHPRTFHDGHPQFLIESFKV